jgi:hypothetical protein
MIELHHDEMKIREGEEKVNLACDALLPLHHDPMLQFPFVTGSDYRRSPRRQDHTDSTTTQERQYIDDEDAYCIEESHSYSDARQQRVKLIDTIVTGNKCAALFSQPDI